jgi:hypothetical protein
VQVNGNTQPLAALLRISAKHIVASQTLIAGGPAITISGTVISLQAAGSSVVVDGQTEALSAFMGVSTTTLGGIIATIGGFGTPTTTATGGNAQASGAVGYNGLCFQVMRHGVEGGSIGSP